MSLFGKKNSSKSDHYPKGTTFEELHTEWRRQAQGIQAYERELLRKAATLANGPAEQFELASMVADYEERFGKL